MRIRIRRVRIRISMDRFTSDTLTLVNISAWAGARVASWSHSFSLVRLFINKNNIIYCLQNCVLVPVPNLAQRQIIARAELRIWSEIIRIRRKIPARVHCTYSLPLFATPQVVCCCWPCCSSTPFSPLSGARIRGTAPLQGGFKLPVCPVCPIIITRAGHATASRQRQCDYATTS